MQYPATSDRLLGSIALRPIPAKTVTVDPEFQSLIPPLSTDELELLEQSILADGCRDALIVWQGHNILVDGHNRYAICQKHNLTFKVIEKPFDSRESALIWIIQNQFGRRNLTPFVRSELALKMKAVIASKAKENSGKRTDLCQNFDTGSTPVGRTNAEVAKLADVSHETIRKVETVSSKAPESVKEAARKGELSVDRAFKLTKALNTATPEIKDKAIEYGITDPQLVTLLEAKQHTNTVKDVLASGCIQPGDEAEAIPLNQASAWDLQGLIRRAEKEHNKAAIEARIEGRLQQINNAPVEAYSVIYADPPWQYDNSGLHGAAERHYPTMTTEKLSSLLNDIRLQLTPDAVLFLWATNPLLPDALKVIEGWGFNYKTNMVWVKDKPTTGLGFYIKGQHELLLIATRGSFLPKDNGFPSVLNQAKGRHSEKPSLYATIETMYPNQRYIELFAREQAARKGWTFWGAEAHVSPE